MKKNKKLVTGLLTLTIATGAYVLTGCDDPNQEQGVESVYNIKYFLDGGINNNDNPSSYKASDNTFSLKDATKTGYTFAGWYEESTFENQVTTIEKGDKGHLELYAKFVPIDYTITYNLDGGELNKSNPTTYNIDSNNITINNPTKYGHTFAGWKDEDNGSIVQFRRILKGTTGNKRYTAQWVLTVYNITTISEYGQVEVVEGANLGDNISFNIIPSPGYEVDEIIINGESFDETKNSFVMPNEDVEIEVEYKLVNYTITYELDGGVNNVDNKSTYTVETESFDILEPTKEGHVFVGWKEESTGSQSFSFTVGKGSTGNRKYIAVWSVGMYDIEYRSAHGNVEIDGTASYGETVYFTVDEDPGYEITSITINGQPINANDRSFTMPGESVLVEFTYAKGTYDIEYVMNGGVNHKDNPETYDIDTELALNEPEKEGYKFIGWYTDAEYNNLFVYDNDPRDLTLYARFIQASVNGVYYEELSDAISSAKDGDIVEVFGNVLINETITINRNITLASKGATIEASETFEGAAMFIVNAQGRTVEFSDIVIDANSKSRVIKAVAGHLSLKNTVITGGYSSSYIAGVYITEEATFEMIGGSISNNTIASRTDYLQYATDLWIGSEASGTIASLGEEAYVGNIFINANSYKVEGGGVFALDGGSVNNVYVEYDDTCDKYAVLNYLNGELNNLMISTSTTGAYESIYNPSKGSYKGGHTVQAGENWYKTLNDAVLAATSGDTISLIRDEEISDTLMVNKNLTFEGNSHAIIPSSNYGAAVMVLIDNGAENVVFNETIIDAQSKSRVIKAVAGHLKLVGCTITGGYSSAYVAGVYITEEATFEMDSGIINGNTIKERSDYLQYATDLWIGSEASGTVANLSGNVHVGSAFINANSYKTQDGGVFTLQNGRIENVYVEYDDESGAFATFNYAGGMVDNLRISTKTTGVYGISNGCAFGTYYGGKLVKIEDQYYDNLEDAVEEANDGDTIHILASSSIERTITINKSLLITGNEEVLKASDDFEGTVMFEINAIGKEIVFNYLTLHGNSKARVIKITGGQLELRDTHVTGGYSASYVAGVYVTEESTFVMHGGSITNNTIAPKTDYLQYATDLWIGSEASGTVATVGDGAIVGNVFVNANSYQTLDGGVFVLDGGTITNVYVEYDEGKSAKFVYTSGEVENIMISTQTTGQYETKTGSQVVTGNYIGGTGIVEEE
ncbi:MAG: InlB B-repeat-containing protein [Bacilli bacterium]|nr:InlB B-repeat-containing protein [Bacilli bacterium]